MHVVNSGKLTDGSKLQTPVSVAMIKIDHERLEFAKLRIEPDLLKSLRCTLPGITGRVRRNEAAASAASIATDLRASGHVDQWIISGHYAWRKRIQLLCAIKGPRLGAEIHAAYRRIQATCCPRRL